MSEADRADRGGRRRPVDDPYGLERFVAAQAAEGFDRAIGELRRGHKTGHWMWFIFPQVEGLGQSAMSRTFAISSLREAKAYLDHPVLGPRLLECTETLVETAGRSAEEILGRVDAQKLRSSMTLFTRAAPDNPLFKLVIERHFGGVPDPATDDRL